MAGVGSPFTVHVNTIGLLWLVITVVGCDGTSWGAAKLKEIY